MPKGQVQDVFCMKRRSSEVTSGQQSRTIIAER
jgi:hypothetical protein